MIIKTRDVWKRLRHVMNQFEPDRRGERTFDFRKVKVKSPFWKCMYMYVNIMRVGRKIKKLQKRQNEPLQYQCTSQNLYFKTLITQ